MYNTESGMSEAGLDILPRFTTWTYCKHKTRRYKHNFSTKGARHKTAEHLRKKRTQSLKHKLKLKVRQKKELRQRLPRMTERNKPSSRLLKRENKR